MRIVRAIAPLLFVFAVLFVGLILPLAIIAGCSTTGNNGPPPAPPGLTEAQLIEHGTAAAATAASFLPPPFNLIAVAGIGALSLWGVQRIRQPAQAQAPPKSPT